MARDPVPLDRRAAAATDSTFVTCGLPRSEPHHQVGSHEPVDPQAGQASNQGMTPAVAQGHQVPVLLPTKALIRQVMQLDLLARATGSALSFMSRVVAPATCWPPRSVHVPEVLAGKALCHC